MTRAAALARQAAAKGLRAVTPLYVTPGSEQVRATIERDGLLADLEAIGATVLANACGPCIGQWDRASSTATARTRSSRASTATSRGATTAGPRRRPSSPRPTWSFATRWPGTLDFDPRTDELTGTDGAALRLEPPVGEDLPGRGLRDGASGFEAPPTERGAVDVVVAPGSERLQLLAPFAPWDGEDYVGLPVLVKARGKCTTDQISAAGPWLRYRGHLERISGNLFAGVTNAFTGMVGEGRDPRDGANRPYPEIAKGLADQGISWCAVGDDNYGEGSSREHAAMEPRYRGGVVILARSFARIHETNLKKQGILPLTFADRDDYEAIGEQDRVSVLGLAALEPGQPVRVVVTRPDGSTAEVSCRHSLSAEQLEWFRAGSALNVIGRRRLIPVASDI